jgi:hypothetical protein
MKYQDCVEQLPDDGSDNPASGALAEANINPATGLATDYLNHFIEALMLLEMISSTPEFRDEFLCWQPVSYPEYFAGSHSKAPNTALVAYERADPRARAQLDVLTDAMTAALESARAALRAELSAAAAGRLAGETAAVLKPLVARAGAVINGHANIGDEATPQNAIDDFPTKA